MGRGHDPPPNVGAHGPAPLSCQETSLPLVMGIKEVAWASWIWGTGQGCASGAREAAGEWADHTHCRHELGWSGWFGQDKPGHGVVVLGSIIASHSATNKCISSGGELSLRCYCSAAPWRLVILCVLQCLGLMSTKCEFPQSRRAFAAHSHLL